MSKLQNKITELSNYPYVQKKIVESFLMDIDIYDMKRPQAEATLDLDSKLFKWNDYTVSAIRVGINYIYIK